MPACRELSAWECEMMIVFAIASLVILTGLQQIQGKSYLFLEASSIQYSCYLDIILAA